MAALFNDPEKEEVVAGDAWTSKPYEFGEYPGYDPAVEAGFEGTVEEWLAEDPGRRDTWVADDLTTFGDWASQWRVTENSSTAIDLTVDTSELAEGRFTVSATEEQTRAMGRDGVFDIQASTPRVRTFVKAKTKYIQDVTRG